MFDHPHPRRYTPVLIFLLTLLPAVASANAGTPLMWASAFHLIIGNLFIGILEGSVMAQVFRVAPWKAIGLAISANYASAWIGYALLMNRFVLAANISIETFWVSLVLLIVVAFILSLLIEFPFFWYARRIGNGAMTSVGKALLFANFLSYVLLITGYALVSPISLLSQNRVVTINEMDLPESCVVFFISQDGHKVVQLELSDVSQTKIVSESSQSEQSDRLIFKSDTETEASLHLLVKNLHPGETPTSVPLLPKVSGQLFGEPASRDNSDDEPVLTWWNFGQSPATSEGAEWNFKAGFWAGEGLTATRLSDKRTFHFAMELPFFQWEIRNVTHLPGDVVLFQLGADQICVMQPSQKKIALVARGRGPAVIKKLPPVSP
jgi:hypothetical protein